MAWRSLEIENNWFAIMDENEKQSLEVANRVSGRISLSVFIDK